MDGIETNKPALNTTGEKDSFDDMKFEPIDMEPVFSTAAGVRIEVSDASLERTKQLFQKDNKPKSFQSPVVRGAAKSRNFISPFRSSEEMIKPKTPNELKRPQMIEVITTESDGFPPSKRSKTCVETPRTSPETMDPSEFSGKVVRLEEVPECSETRLILQNNSDSSKILVRIPKNDLKMVKIAIFDHIRVITCQILRKKSKVEEILAKDLEIMPNFAEIKKTGEEHSFASRPYIKDPSFIYELEATGNAYELQTAILKVNIVDFGPKLYNGCANCRYRYSSSEKRTSGSDSYHCPSCDEDGDRRKCIFSLMRVVDFSGQMEVYVRHEVMKGFLAMMGYREIRELDKFCSLQEQINCIFKPIMMRLKRRFEGVDEWEALEFAEVDWEGYAETIEEIEERVEASEHGISIENENGSTDVDNGLME